jgi:hypothetical protein
MRIYSYEICGWWSSRLCLSMWMMIPIPISVAHAAPDDIARDVHLCTFNN